MNSIVKSGHLKRHSKSFLSGGWNNVWVVLYQDSSLCVYKRQGDYEIKAKAFMKEVSKHFAYGDFTEGMLDRPDLPAGHTSKELLAIPVKPSHKSKVLWFLCRDESELHEWMNAICSTLPKPSSGQQPPQQQHIPQQTSAPLSSAPPPYAAQTGTSPYPAMGPAPGGPAPLGFDSFSGPTPGGYAGYPQQPAAPQQRYNIPQQAFPAAPQQAYPQQGGYPTQSYAAPPPRQAAYPQMYAQPPPQGYSQPPPGAYGYQQQPVYYQQQQPVVQHHKKNKGLGGNTGKMAAGLIGGAALGYGASRMMGGGFGGPFGGFGLGRHGSWSSLSSFGSCGSFGSFGSFD